MLSGRPPRASARLHVPRAASNTVFSNRTPCSRPSPSRRAFVQASGAGYIGTGGRVEPARRIEPAGVMTDRYDQALCTRNEIQSTFLSPRRTLAQPAPKPAI